MAMGGLSAQALNLNNFTTNVTNGQCSSDGKIAVSLLNNMAPSGRKVQVKLDIPGDPVGRTVPLEVGVTGKDSYTFDFLKAGSYTVTVIDVNTNKNASKVVTVASNYVSPEFVTGSLIAESPSCVGIDYDGKISFKIPAGSKGPFVVKLSKGGTVIYNQTHTKANQSQILAITIQGTASQQIKAGKYILTVEDQAGGIANCGETVRREIEVLSSNKGNPACMEFEFNGETTALYLDIKNCKFNMSFPIKRKDNVSIYGLENQIKAIPNAAILKVYDGTTKALKGTYNLSDTYGDYSRAGISNSHSFATNGKVQLEMNDIVEITINVGKTPIVKKFKLDENLVDVLKNRTSSTDVPANKGHYVFLNSEGSVAVEASDRSDLNVDPADPCPPGNTKRYMLVRSYFRKLELSNPDNPAEKTNIAYYRWQGFDELEWVDPTVPGAKGYYFEIYKYIGTGYPGLNSTLTGGEINDPTKWQLLTPGSDFNWINNAGTHYADLTGQGDGWYKAKYKTIGAGVQHCFEPEHIGKITTTTTLSKMTERFNGMELNKGAYKGTVSIRKWLAGYHYNYPITVKIDYMDDGKSGTTRTFNFQTSLPFEATKTVTYTFPIVKTVGNPDTSKETQRVEFGDIPPGNYNITITDRCGNSASKQYNLNTPMQYSKENVKVTQGCQGTAQLSYEIDATPVGTVRNLLFTLRKKNPATGQFEWLGTAYQTRNRNHTFNNLVSGEYELAVSGFYYSRIAEHYNYGQPNAYTVLVTDPTSIVNGYSEVPSPDAVRPSDPVGNGTIAYHVSRSYYTIKPNGELQRDVVGTSCDASSGSGIIAVHIKNPDYIRYPLTFILEKGGTVVSQTTFQEDSKATGVTFKNLTDGQYVVRTIHACQSNMFDTAVVNTNSYTHPGIRAVARTTNPCNGDIVDLTFGGSTQLFDIEWFRIEADGTETSLGFTQTISDTVNRDTKYVVRYKLQDANLCVNRTGESSVTVQFTKDTIPPVITGCPTSTIVVDALSAQCYGVPTWGVVTATDNCRIGTWSQSHQSGERFPVGTHTVTYVFKDTSGNTATCTFNVIVRSRAVKMAVKTDYVDDASPANVINRDLGLTESLNYRIRYKNEGTANVTSATLQVTLPNHPNVTVGTPILSKSGPTIFKATVIATTSNTITFNIPAASVTPGGDERTILIPLTLNGDCAEVGKPCMNLLTSTYSFTYVGGLTGCTIPEQTATGSKTIAISTQNCIRNELACSNGVGTINTFRIQATPGFTEYKWYKNNQLQPNPLNLDYLDATQTATYKVEKIAVCGGVTYTTTEVIQLQTPQDMSDPIKPQSNGGDLCLDNNIWVSHFILCNQPSRNIVVNFRNSDFVWQKLKAGSSPNSLNCPNVDDSAWEDIHSNRTFVANAAGHFRLRVTNPNGCSANFYFDVFTNSLSGQILDSGPVTNFVQGFIKVQMATAGITYKYVLKDEHGNVVNQNGQPFVNTTQSEYTVPIAAPGDYTVEVTSPALPDSCKLILKQKIEKKITVTAKATPKAWKGCNLRTIRFEASGGKTPYKFAIWSIDGVVQNGYTDYNSVPASAFVATIPVGSSFVEADVHIDQPGKYVFIARDDVGAHALTPEVDIYPENFLGYTIKTRDILCGFADNTGQISVTYNTVQNVRTSLYKYDGFGGKTFITENGTGFFSDLTAGRYEIEIKIIMGSVASAVCTYRNPNVVIKSIESTLRAYAGVLEDISCDTATPSQYKVRINNVSGGTGTGYEYSANNVTYSTNPVLMVGSTASVVYVRDSNKCTLELPISIRPIVPPTVTATTVSYDCEGKGTFTVTANPSGNYQYRIIKDDGTLSETRTSNVFTLNPGIYSIEAIYTPASATGTTPNILFKEDFGKGADTCDSESIFITCAAGATTLGDNQYMITRQVPTGGTNWVTTPPSDASGVTDGRYLAINGVSPDNNEGVVYRRTINDIVPGSDIKVSVKLFNLLPPSFVGGANPNLMIRLYNPANPSQGIQKSLGELQRTASWVQKEVTFDGADINFSSIRFEIRNTTAASIIGSDLAVDDIVISQPTKLCTIRTEGISVKVEGDKAFKVRGVASDEKCGKDDGSIRLTVDNPAGTSVQYHVAGATVWTPLTLTPITATQGVATITGLSAVNNGTLYVRRTSDPSCETSIDYTIKKPVPLTVTATVTAPVTCLNTYASVHFTGTGGARPYKEFSFSPLTGSTSAATHNALNNEADINLTKGTYIIQVKDANDCTATATLEVPDAKPLQVEVLDLEPCFPGANGGRLQLKATSGNGEYKFSKDGGATFENAAPNSNSYIFENLSAGTYNFVIKDGADCQTSTTYTIDNPLRIQVAPVNPLTCVANSEAEFKITYTGGKAGTREFLWSHTPTTGFTTAVGTGMTLSQSGNVFTFKTKVEGDYYFKVRYQMPNGDYCEVISTKQEVKVVLPSFSVTPTVEDVSCAGANTGKIRINPTSITGGVPPYTLLVNDGLTTQPHPVADITGLQPGTYTITIEDSISCKSVPVGFTVSEVTAMVASVTHTPITCASTGTQLATAEAVVTLGGTAPYKFTLVKNGADVQSSTNIQRNTIVPYNNLDIGNYQIVIEDAKGCKYTHNFVVNSKANGLDVRGTSVIGCAGNTGEVAVSVYDNTGGVIREGQYISVYHQGMQIPYGAAGGQVTMPDGHIWYRGGAVVSTTLSDGTVVQASTYTYTASAPGVVPGVTYTFIVYDSNTNCTFTKEANIHVPTQSTLSVTVNGVASTTCADANDGKVFVNLKHWDPSTTNITYNIHTYPPTHPGLTSPSAGVTTGSIPVTGFTPAVGRDVTIENVPAGRYFVLFTDGSGCSMGSKEFTIGKSTSLLTVTATVTKLANCKQPATVGLGRIAVEAAGGTAPYQYYYHNLATAAPTGTALENALTNSIDGATKNVESGNWQVFVRDANGCTRNTILVVGVDPQPSIAKVNVHDSCNDNADYPISVVFNTIGVGQNQYKIDGITNWQNITVATETTLPIRLAPNTSSYTISFRDANGCETSTTFKVNEMIKYKASHTPMYCGGSATTTINVTNITGGSGTYKIGLYKIIDKDTPNERAVTVVSPDTDVTGNSHSITTGYGIGNYRIHVYDKVTFGTSAECAKVMDFNVVSPQIPQFEVLSVSTPTCAGGTATIRLKATPIDVAPYTFNIVEKTSGTTPAGVTITPNVNYVTITGVPSRGVTLGGFDYYISAQSAYSCTTTITVNVTSPDRIDIAADSFTKEAYECVINSSGFPTGETTFPKLHLDMSGVIGGTNSYTRVEFKESPSGNVVNQQPIVAGVTKYTYELPNYLTTTTSYYAEVYDTNGCSATTTVQTISATLIMSSLTAVQTQPKTCAVDESFSVTVSTTTVYNNEPIEYSISKVGWPGTIAAPVMRNSLTWTATISEPGNYIIRARNTDTNCEVTANYSVLEPNTLLLEAKDPKRITCKGGTGEITLELTDTRLSDGDQVANGFSYVITPLPTGTPITGTSPSGTIVHTGLPAGHYKVEATSPLTSCSAIATFELVEAGDPITVFAKETRSVTCDNNRGEILVTVSGGWAPYTVNIQGGAITRQKTIALDGDSVLFDKLSATGTPGGSLTYNITITDAWGCNVASGTTSVTLLDPDPIAATISVTQHLTCYNSTDGIITVSGTVTGGSGSYYFTLINNGTGEIYGPQSDNPKFDNLPDGVYTYEIMDTWGCNLRTTTLEIIKPKPVTISVVTSTTELQVCYGGHDGSFEFTVQGGRPPYNVKIYHQNSNTPHHVETGVVSNTVRTTGLFAGEWRVEIQDGSPNGGCTMSPTYVFNVDTAPDLNVDLEVINSCKDNKPYTELEVRFKDEVDVNKITYRLNGTGAYKSLGKGVGNQTNVFRIAPPDLNTNIQTQTIELVYANKHSITQTTRTCVSTPTTFEVNKVEKLKLTRTPTTVVNTLQVEGKDGVKPYRYVFNGEDYDTKNVYELKITDPDYIDPISGKTKKKVDVQVIDVSGCIASATFYEEYFDVVIPNFFTPNGDGVYDTWAPMHVEKYPFIRSTIFDRFGRRLKVLRAGEAWDGKYEGRDMPTGDYWYIVELTDEFDTRVFNGNFTLYR